MQTMVNQFCWKRQLNPQRIGQVGTFYSVAASNGENSHLQHLIWSQTHIRCRFVNINYLIIDRIVWLDTNAKMPFDCHWIERSWKKPNSVSNRNIWSIEMFGLNSVNQNPCPHWTVILKYKPFQRHFSIFGRLPRLDFG